MNELISSTVHAPDPGQAVRFFSALFPADACIHFRAVPEPRDGRAATNHHYQHNERFPEAIASFLEYCFVEERAAFFLPALAHPSATGKDAVAGFTSIAMDLDRGNPDDGLKLAETILGPADIVVESGGTTEHGPKLHAYWKLDQIASTPVEIAEVCSARKTLAERCGGDPAFKQQAQIIRIPGSVHFKNGPKLVRVRKWP